MGVGQMNWVEKFYEMQMSDLENPIVEKNPLFIDGITVRTPDSEVEIVVYQEPFSDIVAMTVYDENQKELYTDRMIFVKDKNDWIILPNN